MDLFPAPLTSVRIPPETPYICGSDASHPFVYNKGDWLTFPKRMGKNIESLYVSPGDTEQTLCVKRSLLQAWLFFGLLLEFLDQKNVRQDMFIEVANGREIISWVLIREHLSKWTSHVQNTSRDAKTHLKIRLDKLTVMAGRYVVFFCDGQFDEHKSPLPDDIALSILLLASLLELAKAHVSAHLLQPQRIPAKPPEPLLANLISQNWCPGDVLRMRSTLTPLWAVFYLSLLGPPRPSAQHWGCDRRRCSAYRIDGDGYVQRHVEHCNCHNFMSVQAKTIRKLIISKQVPLLLAQIPPVGRSQIEIHILGKGIEDFVAISHVWSDGLGNPVDNSLPRCQVERIQQWCDEILPHGSPGRSTPFWMDTLCIPRDGPAKTLAIKSMIEIYSLAKVVLVIDQDLLKIPTHVTDLELAARMYSCGWLRRVWTLQEAAKAQSLYIRLSDGFLHLETLLQRVSHQVTGDVPFDPSIHLAAEFLTPFATISSIAGDVSGGVGHAVNTVEFRDTTNPGDEVACINGILGWEEEDVSSEATTQARLQNIFLRQSFIQSDFLFLQGQRMTERGWRWAPASLTQQRAQRLSGPLTSRAEAGGLHGVYDGILVEPVHGQVLRDGFILYNQYDGTWLAVKDTSLTDSGNVLVHELETEVKISRGGWIDSLRRPAILLQHKLPRPGGTISTVGVLVDIEDERSGVFHALFCCSVALGLPPDEFVRDLERQKEAKGLQALVAALSEFLRLGKSVEAGQRWCVF